jgi:hypothetical protein
MRKALTVGSLIEAIDRLVVILEAPRKGLKHPKHTKHVAPARRRVETILRGYWARQEAAILREITPKIAHLLASFPRIQEATSTVGNRFAANLLPSSLHPLRFPVTPEEARDYDSAMTDAIMGAAKVMAKDLAAGEIIATDFAARYLRDNSLTRLTGNFAETSVQRLRDSVAKAWDAGGSQTQVIDAIKSTFADFSDARAKLVANTEISDAYNTARFSVAKEAGLDEKSWETESGDPCQICLDNEAQGYIDIEEDFDSGDDAPTAHPNCLCTLNFRKSSGAEG